MLGNTSLINLILNMPLFHVEFLFALKLVIFLYSSMCFNIQVWAAYYDPEQMSAKGKLGEAKFKSTLAPIIVYST